MKAMSEFEEMLEELAEELEDAGAQGVTHAAIGRVLVAVGRGLQVSIDHARLELVAACTREWPELAALVARHVTADDGRANARVCYSGMPTDDLRELQAAFEKDRQRSPAAAEFCADRLKLIADVLSVRGQR